MKKKITALFLAVFLTLTLSSCASILSGVLGLGGNTTSHTGKPWGTYSLEPLSGIASIATPTLQPTIPEEDFTEDQVLDYFREIAMRSEYGSGDDGFIRRWEQPVYVEVHGSYTQEDYDTLINHIEYMNATPGVPEITVVSSGGNFRVYFVPLDQMDSVFSNYTEGNWGYFSYWWNGGKQITKCDMAIATDVTNQRERNHLIMEEFTQGFGLANDSPKYENSIFQIEWTDVQTPATIDNALIQMLYSPVISAGMLEEDAMVAVGAWVALGNLVFN